MSCPRCKRVLINAGIKEVVTIDESGNITKYDVKSWVEEDKNRYLDVVEKVKKNQLSK
jgi:deoxycytidylate deaminase